MMRMLYQPIDRGRYLVDEITSIILSGVIHFALVIRATLSQPMNTENTETKWIMNLLAHKNSQQCHDSNTQDQLKQECGFSRGATDSAVSVHAVYLPFS